MYGIIYAIKGDRLNGKYMTKSQAGNKRFHSVEVRFSIHEDYIPSYAEEVIKVYKTKRHLLNALKKWEIDISEIDQEELNMLK